MNQNKQMKKCFYKLNETIGSSLSETLVTVLLLSIVLLAVVSGIDAARNSYSKIVRKAEAMTLLSTISVGMEADLASAETTPVNTNVTVSKDDGSTEVRSVVQFKSGMRGYMMYFDTIKNSETGLDEICVIGIGGSSNVIIPVATNAAHAKYLQSRLEMEPWDADKGYFEYTISILYNDQVITSQNYVTRPYK